MDRLHRPDLLDVSRRVPVPEVSGALRRRFAGLAAIALAGSLVAASYAPESPVRLLPRMSLPFAGGTGDQTSSRQRADASAAPAAAATVAMVDLHSPAGAAPVEAPAPAAPRPAWQPPDVPRRAFTQRVERWRPLVRELLAEAWNEGRLDGPASRLDDDLVLALIQQESAGDASAISWAGALGLMQVMPFTFAEMHHGTQALADDMELHVMLDVRSNARAGIRYLALAMQAHEGNLYWALASYNAGIEAVHDWRAVGLYAVPPIGGYDETANYTQVISKNYRAHRPDVQMYIPDPMPSEHVAGAVRALKDAGRW